MKKVINNKRSTRPRTTRRRLPTQTRTIPCANCAQPLMPVTRFCPQCGQKNHDLNIPLSRIFEEMAEGILHLDNKSLQTIKALVFKPGFLTAEYITGKRARYVSPVRLYIFISFLFFFLLALPAGKHVSAESKKESTELAISFFGISSRDVTDMVPAQLDSVMQKHSIDTTLINRYIMHQLVRVGSSEQGVFAHTLVKGISYMMFALMPVFALTVYWLNRRKAQHFIGTLVFSVHYHCLAFLLFFILAVFMMIGSGSILWLVPFIFLPIYLFLALRRVYTDTRIVAALKTFVVCFTHILSMIFLFIVTTIISLLLF
jgi:hypothetical protein